VTAFGKGTAERARTATQVEDTTWPQSGEGEVEFRILRPRVNEVINLCDLRLLIVQCYCCPAAKDSIEKFVRLASEGIPVRQRPCLFTKK
jgi:hypothetical protein